MTRKRRKDKTTAIISDVSFTFKSCYIKIWQVQHKIMPNEEKKKTNKKTNTKPKKVQMIYLPVIVTTLYSLNNGVIIKKKKLCTAHTNSCRVPKHTIIEPFSNHKSSQT